jgi:hypothetical protein
MVPHKLPAGLCGWSFAGERARHIQRLTKIVSPCNREEDRVRALVFMRDT